MKLLKFCGRGKLRMETVPDPVPGRGEVVIRTVRSAICGSEMACYLGEGLAEGNPGHEAVGIVEQIGPGVSGLWEGQRVGACPVAGCGVCPACREGKNTWCPNRKFYGSMHAEKFLAAANACRILPDDLDWDNGVLLSGDGFGVPFHTARNVLISPVESVAVFGAGPIGLGNLILQKALKRRVFVSDLSEERLRIAETLGADGVFLPQNGSVPEAVKMRTGGRGTDLCIEAAGRSTTARNCFETVRNGGQVIFNGEQGAVPFSISEDFIRRDITATGSWFFHFGEFDEMLSAWRSGVPIRTLISHRFSFEDAAEAYHLFSEGKSAKILLCYPA